ncbi:MAG: 4'-phosphopantetheinyl transferase superfamily protein [Rhodospirillales bacterium]|nr:4'-phosphopantetheinyl transferase superfamily protein [Rhodospirillales bacterium]
MIEGILPEEVVSIHKYGDDTSAVLLPEEAALINKAIDSRKREFATGRACARKALRNLGLPSTPILQGPKREPLWPPGVVGSITHCEGYCAAAVARRQDILAVAIDAEPHDALPPGVLDRVCQEEEQVWMTNAPEGIHWDRLIFSAKESVYKAWFPLTGRWLGFEDVLVSFELVTMTFHARLLVTPRRVANQDLCAFNGHYLVRNGLVVTAITLPQQGLLEENRL